MTRTCIYSRVSTGQQETDNQIMVLTSWADQRGDEVVKIYKEEESAWRSGHQKELATLIADAKKGTIISQQVTNKASVTYSNPETIITEC